MNQVQTEFEQTLPIIMPITYYREGLGFYTKLAESVFRLYKRCQEVCATRRRDRLALDKQAQARTTPSPLPPAPYPPKSSGN